MMAARLHTLEKPTPDKKERRLLPAAEFLTCCCRETMMTAAHLRMPGRATPEEKEQLVDSLIRRLGLTSCAGSLVGDNKKRGLSGGEKKRLSIAAELIAGPKLLFTGQSHAKVLQGGMTAWRCFHISERRAPGCWVSCGRSQVSFKRVCCWL